MDNKKNTFISITKDMRVCVDGKVLKFSLNKSPYYYRGGVKYDIRRLAYTTYIGELDDNDVVIKIDNTKPWAIDNMTKTKIVGKVDKMLGSYYRGFAMSETRDENYQPLAGFEGYYLINRAGKVLRDFKYRYKRNRRINYYSPLIENDQHVSLSMDGVSKRYRIMDLLYATFIGDIPSGKQAMPKDFNLNNRLLSNLTLVNKQR